MRNGLPANTVLMFSSGPAAGEAIGDMFGEALYHASLSQDEYRQLLKDYGFKVVKMLAEVRTVQGIRCGWRRGFEN